MHPVISGQKRVEVGAGQSDWPEWFSAIVVFRGTCLWPRNPRVHPFLAIALFFPPSGSPTYVLRIIFVRG